LRFDFLYVTAGTGTEPPGARNRWAGE